jgi:hypothetical protein
MAADNPDDFVESVLALACIAIICYILVHC